MCNSGGSCWQTPLWLLQQIVELLCHTSLLSIDHNRLLVCVLYLQCKLCTHSFRHHLILVPFESRFTSIFIFQKTPVIFFLNTFNRFYYWTAIGQKHCNGSEFYFFVCVGLAFYASLAIIFGNLHHQCYLCGIILGQCSSKVSLHQPWQRKTGTWLTYLALLYSMLCGQMFQRYFCI